MSASSRRRCFALAAISLTPLVNAWTTSSAECAVSTNLFFRAVCGLLGRFLDAVPAPLERGDHVGGGKLAGVADNAECGARPFGRLGGQVLRLAGSVVDERVNAFDSHECVPSQNVEYDSRRRSPNACLLSVA